MKIVYVAHPIGGDVKGNLIKIATIARQINLIEPEIVPFAPYYLDCVALRDANLEERKRGIKNGTAIFLRGCIDEVRLYGNRVSFGMREEIRLAEKLGVKVTAMTVETKAALKMFRKSK